MDRTELVNYIAETYSVDPDYPWIKSPRYAVFRHENNQKWFAVLMDISKAKLGLPDDEMIDVANLKCDPILIGSLRSEKGIFPAYHMNKDRWITVALDGSVSDDKLKMLLDMSFEATATKSRKRILKTDQ